MKMKRICIVGCGLNGLELARKLVKDSNVQVTLLGWQNKSGLGASLELSTGEQVEKFYHHCFTSDSDFASSYREVLGKELLNVKVKTGSYLNGSLIALSSGLELISCPNFTVIEKIRLIIMTLVSRLPIDLLASSRMKAFDWLSLWLGKELASRFWRPLLISKFGPFAEQIPAQWFISKIKLRGNSRDIFGREILRYPQDGFHEYFVALSRIVETSCQTIGGYCQHIQLLADRKILVKASCGYSDIFDYVVSTIPEPELQKILVNPIEYHSGLFSRRYFKNQTAVIELEKFDVDLYWTNVHDPDFPFVGVIVHNNLDNRDLKHTIVYLSKYLGPDDEFFDREFFIEKGCIALKKVFGLSSLPKVRAVHVSTASYAQPIFSLGHCSTNFEQSDDMNLISSTMFDIYPEDRGLNYAIRNAGQLARSILKRCGNSND